MASNTSNDGGQTTFQFQGVNVCLHGERVSEMNWDLIQPVNLALYRVYRILQGTDSETVEELAEEGNAFEADVLEGLETARDPDV